MKRPVIPQPQPGIVAGGLPSGMARPLILLAIILLFAFGGCATVEPRVSTITNTVSIPVPTPCLAAADVPPVPTPTAIDVERATTDQLIAAMAADALAADAYMRLADPLLRQCAAP